MPITRQAVNDDIAAKITSKIIAKSLTQTDDGANRVLMMDYVDQEIKLKIAKVVLSSLDILNLNSTPITIVPSVVGKAFLPKSVFQKYTHVSTPYSGGINFRLAFNTPSTWISGFVPVIQSADNSEGINNIDGSGAAFSGGGFSGKSLILTAPSAWTGGDGTITLYIEYLEITL